jgi:hypothetical protein
MPANVAIADMAINPARKQIILAGYRYAYGNDTGSIECIPDPVLIVDVQQDSVIGGPDNETNCQGIAVGVSPDGTKAYVSVMASSTGGYNVEVVDLRPSPSHMEGLVQGIEADQHCLAPATSISFSPDGSKAYIAYETCSGSMASRIAVVDAGSDRFLRWVTGLPSGVAYSDPSVKFDPNPARQVAYVTDSTGMTSGVGAVWAVNTQTDAWEKTIVPTESNALLGHFDFSPGGDKAFVADSKNCGVAMIDVAAASAIGFTPMSSCDPDYGMSSGVSSVAVSPGGSTVYAFTNSDEAIATPQVMNSGGHLIGAVANYDGTNSTGGPIVLSTKNGTTAYLSKTYSVFDNSAQASISNSEIAVVRLPSVPAQMQKVSPSTGIDIGGTQVSVSGSHLSGTTSVLFGGAPATGLKVVSDSEVTVTTPPKSVGPTDVTVVNPGGNAVLSNGFTYTTGFPGNQSK